MALKAWRGSIAPSHYPATGGVYQFGDVVDVDDDVVAADPDRWANPPAAAKGKAQPEAPEGDAA